jgi:hypothetical protein
VPPLVTTEYVRPCKKNISHIQVIIMYWFCNPAPIKLKLGTAKYVGTSNSKPPGPIITRKQAAVRSYLVQSCLRYQVHSFARRLLRGLMSKSVHIYRSKNYFAESKWHVLTFLHPAKLFSWVKLTCFDFSSSNFNVQGHSYILSNPLTIFSFLSNYYTIVDIFLVFKNIRLKM